MVGAVVVGFGTSAPEMLVSTLAAANGRLDIGVGNIVGSNVANISLVLGAASFVSVVPVSPGVLRRDAAVSVAAVVLFALLVQGDLGRVEGLVLAAALLAWFVLVLRGARSGAGKADMQDLSDIVGADPPALGVEALRTVGIARAGRRLGLRPGGGRRAGGGGAQPVGRLRRLHDGRGGHVGAGAGHRGGRGPPARDRAPGRQPAGQQRVQLAGGGAAP